MGRKVTTIQVSKETRDLLRKVGHKGETYDQIIRRLIRQVYGKNVDRFLADTWHGGITGSKAVSVEKG